MTNSQSAQRVRTIDRVTIKKPSNSMVILVFVIITILLLLNQSVIKNSLQNSLKMCATSVIPSIFPFMILSDFLVGNLMESKGSQIRFYFCKCFGLSEAAFWPFIIGNVCGFPLGPKAAIDLYKQGAISKEECQRLLGFANNPSLAFVISGVGMGMRQSLSDGLVLYSAVVISSCILGAATRVNTGFTAKANNISKQKYSFVASVKDSASSIIAVCSYIVFFSMITDIIMLHIKHPLISPLLASVLEIGTAANHISKSTIPRVLNLPATAFALGFSGLSVYMQTLSFVPEEISKAHCLIMKIFQGAIAFTITVIYNLLVL